MLLKMVILLSILSFSSFAEEQSSKKCNLDKMKWVGIPFNATGHIDINCKPQILYSWVGDTKTIKEDDYKWPFRRKTAIFFHRTPLATSIYGKFSYRVKLKKNVSFKLVEWNTAHYKCYYPEAEKRTTVYVNQDKNGFSEYVLCSDGPVESWSFGMQEHHNEMNREYSLIKRKGPLNVDGFLNPNTRKYGCSKCFQGYTIRDARNDGSERTILNSMKVMENFVYSRRGKVFSIKNRRSYTSGRQVDLHFETSLKLPFHK
jgi:hypothetical protein